MIVDNPTIHFRVFIRKSMFHTKKLFWIATQNRISQPIRKFNLIIRNKGYIIHNYPRRKITEKYRRKYMNRYTNKPITGRRGDHIFTISSSLQTKRVLT